jgi:hypothetical protein
MNEDPKHEDDVTAVPGTQQQPAANDGWDDVPSDIGLWLFSKFGIIIRVRLKLGLGIKLRL